MSQAKSSGPPVDAVRGDSPPPEPSYFLSALSPEKVLARSLSPPPAAAAAAQSYASPTVLKGTAVGLFWGLILGLVVALIVFCVCLSCCWWRRWRRRRRRVSAGAPGWSKDDPEDPESLCPGMYVFTYKELETATNGFSDSSLLGQGGFGYVHRGVLPDGKEVAVKQLKVGSAQGEREFRAEVDIISRVHHKHLVSLVGYCSAGDDMMLVYEFLPNKTLDFHLHGNSGTHLSWDSRMKIIQGFAQGLAYLHEDCQPRIIHRDIKATNILLDFEFEAKVSDFGLAKILDADTHVTTRVMGTVGYLAPEYATSGKYSHKSDIFSFGVVLLELLTGHHPVDSTIPTSSSISGPKKSTSNNMVDWARPLLVKALESREFDELVDPRLQNIYDPVEVARVVVCATLCVSHCAKKRPRMGEVVRALEGNLSLEHLCSSTMLEQDNSGESSYDSGQYEDDLEKFRKLAFGGLEHGSSNGTSGLTSENGQDRSICSSEGKSPVRGRSEIVAVVGEGSGPVQYQIK